MKNISKKILLTSLIVFSQAKLHSMLGKVNTLKVFSKTNFLLKSKASLKILKDLKKFTPFYIDRSINYLPLYTDAQILNKILNNTEKSFSTTDAQMINVIYQLTKQLNKQELELAEIKFLLKELTIKRLTKEKVSNENIAVTFDNEHEIDEF